MSEISPPRTSDDLLSGSLPTSAKGGEKKKQGMSVLSEGLDPLSIFAMETPSKPTAPVNVNGSPRLEDFDMALRVEASARVSPTAQVPKPASLDDLEKINRLSEEAEDVEKFPYLTGEQILLNLRDAFIMHPSGSVPGMITMTTYRIIFIPSRKARQTMQLRTPNHWFQIPLACIDKLDKEKKGKDIRSNNLTIVLTCKDARVYRIAMMCKPSTVIPSPNDPLHHTEADIDKAINVMFAYAFPNQKHHLFAFSYASCAAKNFQSVEPYDPFLEFARIGILDSVDTFWRVSLVNQDFRICDSYPELLIVPKVLTDDEVKVVANFRSGGRLPVLCWGDKLTGASIWRSSQPKVGVSGSNTLDERYLDILAKSSLYRTVPLSYFDVSTKAAPDISFPAFPQSQLDRPVSVDYSNALMIIDCRPKANAMMNKAAGYGYETSSNYPNSRIDFYNIGNVHVMRDSYRALVSAVCNLSGSSFDLNFSKAVEDTQWLGHLRLVLKASWDCANFVSKGYPVLVHCSHGWDRTPQVTSLSQLFLDPFYRTFNGIKVLVEKEWLSFGHQFSLRSAHGRDKANRQDDQISPIFLQFLDCVWQLQHQFPYYFEFNSRYLLTLADQIYSCRFGTFIADTDKERKTLENDKKYTIPVWAFLEANKDKLTNPLYSPLDGLLLPQLSPLLRSVKLWDDYYLRWSDTNIMIQGDISSTAEYQPPDLLLLTESECIDHFELEYMKERALREALAKTIADMQSGADGIGAEQLVESDSLQNGEISDV